jgi:ABC-type amino acid transport substrate-binding protein
MYQFASFVLPPKIPRVVKDFEWYFYYLGGCTGTHFATDWAYDVMIQKLKSRHYMAVISDDTQLIARAYSDDSCSLHILADKIEPFDLAFAFRKGFPRLDLMLAVSSALLKLQEDGTLAV